MKQFLRLVAILAFPLAARCQETTPAKWSQYLCSTALQGYKAGEYLIISDIYTGINGINATVRYGLRIKISQWNKSFTANFESVDKKTKETLIVTLHQMENPKEMRADYDDQVYQDGRLFLRFAGSTIVDRPTDP